TSLKEPSRATPALLMTMLSRGWAAMAALANAWIWAGSPTSTRWVDTWRAPALPISAATCCSPASSRSASARSQPRAANSSASARPMPLAAPVTAAALPDIAVIGVDSMQVEKEGGFRNFRKLELNNKALRALTSTTRQKGHRQTGANSEEAYMGQSKPLRATALIVEDDPMQRDMICLLLEESEVDVIECESAEAAEQVLERAAGSLVLMMTDVQLAGNMDGVELAHIARKYNPDMGV